MRFANREEDLGGLPERAAGSRVEEMFGPHSSDLERHDSAAHLPTLEALEM